MKGHTGAIRFGVGVLLLFAVLSLFLFYVVPVFSSTPSSPSSYNEFNVTYDTSILYINWTGDVINVTAKVEGLFLYVENISTQITANYSQSVFYSAGGNYPNLDNVNYSKCFTSESKTGMKFIVQNASSGIYANSTNLSANSDPWILNLTIHPACPPGRYYGYFNIINETNSTGYVNNTANITAIVDIPITRTNTVNVTTYAGFFYGNMSADYYTYHSYYFNTSEFQNSSSVTITLTGFSKDLNLFLFDSSGIIQNTSMNTGTTAEEISYLHLPYNEMWEIRVFGNTTSHTDYTGNIYFSRIDVNVSSIDFGTLDPRQYESRMFRINNTDTQNVTNVIEIAEVYLVRKFTNGTYGHHAANYSIELLVPSFAEKIMVKVEWAKQSTGNISNWTLYLTDPNGNLRAQSLDHYRSANVTNATATESVTTTSITEGYWNITVVNASNEVPLSVYNITAYVWFNESELISTNFTTHNGTMTFAGAGTGNPTNETYDINVSITVPNDELINGSYRGFLRYTNGSGWEINLPLSFDVKAGMLVLNHNISNASTTFTVYDNIGIDKSRYVNITYNNSGGYDIYFNYTTSDFNLTNAGSWINFTIDSLPGEATDRGKKIPAYSLGLIDLRLNISNVTTNDVQGTYTGWIAFNTTLAADDGLNETTRSYPYGAFNLTLQAVLNDDLTINISEISVDSQQGLSYEMENVSKNDTFTFNFTVTLANGTRMTLSSHANVTKIWLNESSMTSYGAHLNDISQGDAAYASPICDGDGFCYVNATLRPNVTGGRYMASLNVSWYTGRLNLTGTNNYSYIILNNTGINMSIGNNGAGASQKNIGTVDEGHTVYFNLTVTNYGNKTANGKLLMSTWTYVTIAVSTSGRLDSGDDCRTTSSGRYFLMDIPESKTCWFVWSIAAASIDDGNKSCTGDNLIEITSTDPAFANMTGITLTVGNADGSASDGNGNGNGNGVTYNRSISIRSFEPSISIALGGTNSTNITVRNTGNVSSTAKTSVSIDGMTTSVSPSYCNLAADAECDFNITFNVNNDTSLGDHAGTYKAYVSGYEDTWYHEESFTVVVLSTPEREAEINASYENMSAIVQNLTNVFNALKPTILGLVAENNLTRIEDLVNETNTLIAQVWSAILSGDYITAEEKLTEIDEKISMISLGLTELKDEADTNRAATQGGIWIWVVIGVIIAGAAGFLIYMLMPPSGYHPKYGYKKAGIITRIKRFFKRKGKGHAIKGKMSAKGIKKVFKREKEPKTAEYAKEDVKNFYEGYEYEKQPASEYGYRHPAGVVQGRGGAGGGIGIRGITKKLKGLFKRKKQRDIFEYMGSKGSKK